MDLNINHKNIKLLGKKQEKTLGPRNRQKFLRLDTKSTIHKRKNLCIEPHQNLKTLFCE